MQHIKELKLTLDSSKENQIVGVLTTTTYLYYVWLLRIQGYTNTQPSGSGETGTSPSKHSTYLGVLNENTYGKTLTEAGEKML
jgi:hypothetical protein